MARPDARPAAGPAYRSKVRADRWTNFSVLRHGRFDGMLVTSKNSGTHWIKYMFAVALAETHGLPHPEYFSEQAVRPYIGWPKDAPAFPQLPRLAFSHTIPHALMDWAWARRLAGLPRYVIAVRHPMAILASHFDKWSGELGADWLTYLAGDPSGRRYRCDLFWLARFWNRWGEVILRDPDRFLVLRYEETLAGPEAALRAMAAHWGVSLSERALAIALAAGTKEAMAQKIDPEAERNVLQNRAGTLADRFSGEALMLYRHQISALFLHDLGYDLEALPE